MTTTMMTLATSLHAPIRGLSRATAPALCVAGALALLASFGADPVSASGRRDSDDRQPRAASASDARQGRAADTRPSAPSAPAPSAPAPGVGSGSNETPRVAVPRPSGGGSVDDRRGDARHPSTAYRPGTGRGSYSHHRRYPYRYWGYYDPYDPWGYGSRWIWGWGVWGPYFYYYDHPGYARGGGAPGDEAGALDLDVSPEKAEIYVDGQYVGRADDFDGFPSFLWLPAGTYDVVIYRPGFRTIARQYSIYPGLILDVEDRMEPGEAVRPEDLPSRSTAVRDARLRREEERQADAAAEPLDEGREAWREREPARGAPERPRAPAAAGVAEADEATGRITLSVDPGDASVYLDGRFLGTSDDLGRLPKGVVLDAGRHTLDCVRPGFRAERREFDLRAGETIDLRILLERE